MQLFKLDRCPSESRSWASYLSKQNFPDSKASVLTRMFMSRWNNPEQTWMFDPNDHFFMDVSNIANLLRTIRFDHETVVWNSPRELAEWAGKHPLFGKGLILTNKFNFERIKNWQITNTTHWTLESSVFVPQSILSLVPQRLNRDNKHRQGVTRRGDKYRGQYKSRAGRPRLTEFDAYMDFCVLRIESAHEYLFEYQNQYQPSPRDVDTIVDGFLAVSYTHLTLPTKA